MSPERSDATSKLSVRETESMSASNGKLTSMRSKPVRTEPPSASPNNQDALVFSLYLLSGADRDIDVEDLFLKCHELAPARLSWRTRPDLPDYKKVSKALQSVEASTHVGLFHRTNQYYRRLTLDGVKWVETYLPMLERVYLKAPVHASKNTNLFERKRHEIKSSSVWQIFKSKPASVTIVDLALVLQCSAASSPATWASRVQDVKRASHVLQDEELLGFALFVEDKVLNGESR